MQDEKIILKVEIVANELKVSLGTQKEALLALALRKAALFVDEVIAKNEQERQANDIKAPEGLIKRIS